MKISENRPGHFSLVIVTGVNPIDKVIVGLGHEPNGYFWEGVAERLVATESPGLDAGYELDSEAGMFCAHASDRAPLETLESLMRPAFEDAETLRSLVTAAKADGFVFDD